MDDFGVAGCQHALNRITNFQLLHKKTAFLPSSFFAEWREVFTFQINFNQSNNA